MSMFPFFLALCCLAAATGIDTVHGGTIVGKCACACLLLLSAGFLMLSLPTTPPDKKD
jgi:hypothetical protein